MMPSLARAAVSLALASVPSVAVAADLENTAPAENDKVSDATPAEKPRETSFAVVPGPFYNPNLGAGITSFRC